MGKSGGEDNLKICCKRLVGDVCLEKRVVPLEMRCRNSKQNISL